MSAMVFLVNLSRITFDQVGLVPELGPKTTEEEDTLLLPLLQTHSIVSPKPEKP